MTVKTYVVGPGTLNLGAEPFAFASQLTAARVNPTENVTTREAVKVLSGEELPERVKVKFSHTLTGTVYQDLSAGGIVDWTWAHAGETVPFVYVPVDADDRAVGGLVSVVPLTIGGDVDADEPTAEFTFRIVGQPIFGAADFVESEVETLV